MCKVDSKFAESDLFNIVFIAAADSGRVFFARALLALHASGALRLCLGLLLHFAFLLQEGIRVLGDERSPFAAVDEVATVFRLRELALLAYGVVDA